VFQLKFKPGTSNIQVKRTTAWVNLLYN
jgi:hypothetical protein